MEYRVALPHPTSAGVHRERDIHMPERVLQDLCEFGRDQRAGGHGVLDDAAVEAVDGFQTALVQSGYELGCVVHIPGPIAPIDPVGAEAEVEVKSRQP